MAGDIYFHDVTLLLHCEGADASTTFTDSSEDGRTVTAGGNAQIDTQYKFGAASALFDGTGDYLSLTHAAGIDLTTGDFTIECWVRLNAIDKTQGIYTTRPAVASTGAALRVQSTNKVFFYITGQSATNTESTSALSANIWYHIAVTRSGSSIRLFIDGTLETTTTSSATGSAGSAAYIGAEKTDGSSPLDGWIDEFRITDGVARYTANFTAPSAAFPDYREVPGTGALASAAAAIAGTGTAISYLTGTGALAAQSATISGTGRAFTTLTGTGTLAAQSAAIAGTGSLPMRGCFYAYNAWHQGDDYLYRALPAGTSATRWTFATRIQIPSNAALDYSTILVIREGATGYPNSECKISTYVPDPYVIVAVYGAGSEYAQVTTYNEMSRDVWHDLVVHYDSANAVEANRIRVWIDSVEETLVGIFPTRNLAAFGGTVVPDPYLFLLGYEPGETTSALAGAIADTLFLSGRNVTPVACHDYCGAYNAYDWHLRYLTSSVGTDSSGNGYNFTEEGTGTWIEPTGDLCLRLTFPVTLENYYRIDAGIPVVFRVKSTPTLPTLGITLGTYAVSPTLPVVFRLSSTPTLPTLPIAIYSNTESAMGAFVTWRPKVILDGTDISAKLIGAGEAEIDEMSAPIASFSFLPAAGTVDPLAYVSKPVRIAIETLAAGVATAEHLVFTGVVSDPTWSVDDRVLTISATGDLQSRFDSMTKAQIATQLAAASPTYSETIFGDADDMGGWEYAEALISTTPYVIWQDAAGMLRVTSTLAKVSADHEFTEAGFFVGSDISYPGRMDLLNKLDLQIQYRFERKRSREIKVSFHPWQLATPYMWLSCEGGWDLPQRDQIASAAEGSGWYPTSDITYTDVWPNGSYGTRGCSGSFFEAGVSILPEVRETLCVGANWTAARRWNQTVTETATITVGASESQAVVGVLADSESYAFESEYQDEEWEDSLANEDYSTSGMTAMTSGDYKLDLDTDRSTFTTAQTVAINKARNDILKSHRGTTFTFQTTFSPQVDLSHTVHVECDWAECQGKVRRVTHRWDIDSGGCTSEIAVALYRHNGAGIVTDTPVAATDKAADPDETAPEKILKLGMYIGGRDDVVAYDENWTGYIINMPTYESASTDPVDRSQVWSRDPANPALKDLVYPEGFHMKYPDVDASYADPANVAATAEFDVAIPEDLLLLTSG